MSELLQFNFTMGGDALIAHLDLLVRANYTKYDI
jgi:hypothetical protein